jgi:hypothetical protein
MRNITGEAPKGGLTSFKKKFIIKGKNISLAGKGLKSLKTYKKDLIGYFELRRQTKDSITFEGAVNYSLDDNREIKGLNYYPYF